MALHDILGQPQAIHILQQALTRDSLSHAYLFYGPESTGKKRTAFELAKTLNCETSGPREACGACASCRRIDRGLHPDVFFLEPEKTGTVREAWIKIDPIRELQKKLGFLPYEGRTKVALLDGADRMNPQAANAFLKTLEEPPSATLLILITAHPQQLAPTLVSRCQGIRFHPLPEDALRRILEAQGPDSGLRENEIPLRAARAGGRVARALDADLAEWNETRRHLVQLVRDVSFERMDLVFAFARVWAKEGGDVPQMLQELAGLVRDLVLVQLRCPPHLLLNRDLAPDLAPVAAGRTRHGWVKMHDAVQRTRQALRGNANVQLALETLMLDFCEAR